MQTLSLSPGASDPLPICLQASWNGACTVCELVHKYISALWAIVIAGFAVLAYCAVTASIKAFSEPAPTDPVSLSPRDQVQLDYYLRARNVYGYFAASLGLT